MILKCSTFSPSFTSLDLGIVSPDLALLLKLENFFKNSNLKTLAQLLKEKSYFLLNPGPVLFSPALSLSLALLSLQHAVRVAHPDHNLCQLHSIRCPNAIPEQ